MKVLFAIPPFTADLPWSKLAEFLPGWELASAPSDEAAGHLDGVDVLIAYHADAALLERAPSVGLLHQFGVGLDRIDVGGLTRAGVWVARLPAEGTGNGESVAETAVLLMLALAKRLGEAERNLASGRWAQPMGESLLGKSACIVGLGGIGGLIAARLAPFGMTLTGVRAHPGRPAPQDKLVTRVYASEQLKEAVGGVDYVVLSINYTAEMRGMFDAGVLAAMKPGARIVNIARGGLIDESALTDALASGHIGGAGLDVFAQEPIDPASPLLRQPSVVATPHIGGVSDAHFWMGGRKLGENLARYADGLRFDDLVNAPERPRRNLGG